MRFITNLDTKELEVAESFLLKERTDIAIDIETVSLENKLPLGIGVAVNKAIGYYFFDTRDTLVERLIDQTPTIITFNASFDVPILRKLGYTVSNYEDAMLLAYSCGLPERGLEELSRSVLGAPFTSVTSQWKKKDQGNVGIDHTKMAGWCLQHALNTYNLWHTLPKTPLYREIDKPCIDLTIEMEEWGLLIDQYMLTNVEQDTMSKALKLEEEIKAELGFSGLNLASNPQVASALQMKGILGTRKTKSATVSVSDESLRPLKNPLADKILKWRSLMKTVSTYVPAFRRVDEIGRLHTVYGYTNTGRWKSGDKQQKKPNLQNITRDEKFTEEEE